VNRHGPGQEGYDSDADKKYEHDDGEYYYLRNIPSNYGSDADMGDLPAYMNIGVIPTTADQDKGTGRIVAFPNWVQHRVVSVFNDPSASTVAVRKIVSSTQSAITISFPDSLISCASSWWTTPTKKMSSTTPASAII
jgi:hypothetical protein